MSTADIARAAAEHIAAALLRQTLEAWHAEQNILDIAEPVIAGAIRRALDEAGQAEARTVYAGGPGAVDVKITKSTQGVSLEIDVKRPREDGEDYRVAADASALLSAYAYQRAADAIGAIGLTPGKDARG